MQEKLGMRKEELGVRGRSGSWVRGSLPRDFVSGWDERFLDGSAPLGIGRRAVLYRKPVHSLRALMQIANRTSRTWRQPRAVCVRAVKPVRRTSSAGFAGDSGAHSALSCFRDSESDCLSSRGSRKTMGLAVMFHVKQFLFLPVFHVEKSCFSVRQATARPVSPSLCHSERSEESPSFKANPSSTCGDSSSQAPQNDNEKRNDGGQPP